MDIVSIIPLAISLLFLLFVVVGFLVGLIRGLKKTVIRTIWVVVIGILLMFITTPIALSLLRSDITWIPGIAEAFQGASSLEEFLAITITQSVEGINAQDVQPLISFATSLVAMFISGILFLVFFILLKLLSLPLYWILNIFIGKSKGGKKRLLGGAVGALLGVLIFTLVSTPIVGYVNIVKKIDDIPINGLVPAPYTASADEDNGGGIISSSPAGEILNSLDDSVVMKVYGAIGLKNLQLVIFNQTSAVKISGETIKINNEIDSIGNVVVQILPFVDGTIDVSNFEAIMNDPDQLEYFSTSVSGLLTSLYDSKLFTTALDTAMPLITSALEDAIVGSLTESSGLDPTLVEPISNMLSDFLNGIANSEPEKISQSFTSVFEVIAIFPKLSGEEGINSLTGEDFSKLGGVLDTFIDSGLIKQQTINELIPAVLDMALNAMSAEGEIPEVVTTLINDLKQAFQSGDISYANELKVIGELVACFTSLDISEGNITAEQLKSLGASLDVAFSHNSKILTRALVDDLVVGIIDMLTENQDPEFEKFSEVFELVKKPFENHEITSYEKEFDAFGEILDYVTNLDTTEELDLVEVGKKLDGVLAKDSKIINREFVNSVITILIDEFTTELDEDLKPTLEKIKENVTTKEISFEKEFGSIQKLLDTIESIEGEELDLSSIGKTLDEVIAESDIIDHSIVNGAIEIVIDKFSGEIDEDLKPTVEDIKNKITNTEISFEKELGAIQKLLDTFDVMEQESIDLSSIGKTLDEVIAESDIIDHALVNNAINVLIDQVANDISEDYRETIDTIKDGFSGDDIVYENEFEAIDIIFIIIEDMDGEDIDLAKLGEDLDYIFVTIQSKVVTRELVNSTIQLLIDVTTEGIGEENKETIDEIKNGFDRDDLVYKDEFLALDSLLDIFEYANGDSVDLSAVGEQIDTTLAIGSKIITRSLINDTIQILIDEATDGVDSQYQETITEIKNGFNSNELVYETEFLALESLLDVINYAGSTDVDLSNVGKQIDETLALNSKIITPSLINSCIQILIDEATDGVNSEHQGTITEIKNGFTGDDLVYETEFLALESLLDIFDFVGDSDVDLAKVGVQLDKTLELNSKIITRSLINSSIKTLIDDATEGVNSKHNSTITTIKNGFTGDNLSYTTEFLALDSLLDIFDFAGGNDVDLAKVGVQLDQTLDLGSKIITRTLINDSIQILIDDATDGVNAKHQDTITTIKNGFTGDNLSYTTEFLALDSLLDIFDYADNSDVDLSNVGKQIDETIDLNSKIITRTLVNDSIQILIDDATDGVDAQYNGIISDVKEGFNSSNLTYETEFDALDKLLDVINSASVDTDLQSVGQKLDYIVDVLKSKIITRNVINTTIKHIIDESTTDIHDTNVINTVTKIKNGFNRTDLSYELELSTIDTLIEIIDRVEQGHIDLIKFGKDLDADLALNGKIITKTLINEFIASSFDTFVTADDIAHAGSLATSLSNIKVRILDSNYQIESYETEFTAVDKLIQISTVAGNLSIQDVDKKLFDGNTKTIGEVFDDKIKDSILLGDCGLDVIDSLIDTLKNHNDGEGGNRDYTKIVSIIESNFDAIKPNVKCASNKNLNQSGTVTYNELAHSFAEIEHYLDDTTHKVTGQTEFTLDLAEYYEESLNAMQDNILLGVKGTRAIASYICDEVAVILEDKAQAMPYPDVANIIRSYKDIILNYKAYLERPETLANNKLSEKEPYTTNGANEYVTSTDGFKTNITFTSTKPASNFAYRTNPFTSIANEISAYLQ